ncbi:hypothetical protein BST61_g4262 [Cercospora zeina]
MLVGGKDERRERDIDGPQQSCPVRGAPSENTTQLQAPFLSTTSPPLRPSGTGYQSLLPRPPNAVQIASCQKHDPSKQIPKIASNIPFEIPSGLTQFEKTIYHGPKRITNTTSDDGWARQPHLEDECQFFVAQTSGRQLNTSHLTSSALVYKVSPPIEKSQDDILS